MIGMLPFYIIDCVILSYQYYLSKIFHCFQAQSKSQLESRVKDLETSCQSLIEEVTELTDGKGI